MHRGYIANFDLIQICTSSINPKLAVTLVQKLDQVRLELDNVGSVRKVMCDKDHILDN